MDEVKKCRQKEALSMLFKGAFVFTEVSKDIFEERRGCRKCNVSRDGNYCSKCGSKITDKMKVKVGRDVTEFRLQYCSGTLFMETRKDKNSFYSNRRKCDLSLEFFLNQSIWGWIW